jgi:hypothetical protein
MKTSLRNGFLIGLVLALGLGVYLFRLWQPERQVQLHSIHLLNALERKDWAGVGEFVGENYADRWGHDRALLLTRFRMVLPYAKNLHFILMAPAVRAAANEGEWSARITVEADPNEVSEIIKERVNTLDAPFSMQWQRVGKAWEWKLIRVDNAALEMPSSYY